MKTANDLTPEVMKEIGNLIGNLLPGVGFALFLFDFNTIGEGQYISNAQRDDMLKVLQGTIDRMRAKEGQDSANN